MEHEYSGPDWGVIAGFALSGLGAMFVGMIPIINAQFGIPPQTGGWLAIGALMLFVAGVMSFMTSRTVVSVCRRLEERIETYRA